MADREAEGVSFTRLNYDELECQSTEISALFDCSPAAIDKEIKGHFSNLQASSS
jgi:hypothetical protein